MNDPKTRKIIIGSGILVGVVGVIILIVYLTRKGGSSSPSSTNQKINVKISLINYQNVSTEKTLVVNLSKITNYTTQFFVEAMIRQTKMLDWNSVSWVSFSVNNTPLTITNGEIDFSKPITSLIENNNLSLSGKYIAKCLDSAKPTCDICKGQTAVCGKTGWECGNITDCPTHDEIKSCCSENLYASCDSGKISCGQCENKNGVPYKDGKIFDCGPIGCTMIGPVCTNDGWTCEANVLCPVGNELQTCVSGSNMIASCVKDANGKTRIISSACDAPTEQEIASCPESCDKQGLVCKNVNGKNVWQCEKGIHCPSDAKKKECCESDTNNPIGTCSDSSTNVVCISCPTEKPPCEENCFGQGLVCTANGWECKNGVKCPSDMSKCCDSNTVPTCDSKNNCVKCECETGLTSCTEPVCGGIQSSEWISPVCCGNDPPCNKPIGATDYMCCDESRACYDSNSQKYVCCPAGTECKNGECSVICGKNTDGTNNLCDSNNSCLISENLSANDIALLKKKLGSENVKVDMATGNVYTCVPENESCTFDNLPVVFPNKNGEFYPCYEFPTNESISCDSNIIGNDQKTLDKYCGHSKSKLDCENPIVVLNNTTFNTLKSSPNISQAITDCFSGSNPDCVAAVNCVDSSFNETATLGKGTAISSPRTSELTGCVSFTRSPSVICEWSNNTCVGKPVNCEKTDTDNSAGYCISKNETAFDRKNLESDCSNNTSLLDCEFPYMEYPNMQAWNMAGTSEHTTLFEAQTACDNNDKCNSITQCMTGNGGNTGFQERNGFPVNDSGEYCTTYSRTASNKCVWNNGKCVSNRCESITNDKQCENNTNCEWRNVLDFLGSGNGPESNIEQLNKELTYITGNKHGNYCSSDNGAFSRVVGLTASSDCSPLDCWKHVGGSGITDIEFIKGNNGNYCLFTENCESKPSFSTVINSQGNSSSVPEYSVSETAFGNCSAVNFPTNVDPSYHAGLNGTIVENRWACSNITKRCEMTNDGTGLVDKNACSAACCPSPLVRGSDGACYYNPYTSKPNDGIAAWNSMTGGYQGTQILNIPYGVMRCVGYGNPITSNNGYDRGQWQECTNINGCTENHVWYGLEKPNCVVP